MKKSTLLVAAILACGLSASAQTLTDGDYIIYNVETGAFLNGGNSWGTKVSVTNHGQFMTIANNDGKYSIKSHYSNGSGREYVAAGDNTFLDAAVAYHDFEYIAGNYAIKDANGKYLAVTGTAANFNGDSPSEWTLYTKSDYAEWQIANLANGKPADFTAFIPDANFSRNNTDFNLWTGASKMGKGGPNNAMDATATGMNAEKWGGNSTSIDFGTTVTDLPNGKYTLKFQGLYRYNNTTANTNEVAEAAHADGTEKINSYFIANGVKVPFISVADENSVALYGKMPFSQAEASEAFTKGAYQQELEVEVTDGTLSLKVEKLEADHEGCDWTVLDNIELYLTKLAAESGSQTAMVYATVTANGVTKYLDQQQITVSVDGENATVTLPAAELSLYSMESQDVQVNLDADGNISMVEGQTLKFTMGSTVIPVTVTSVYGSYIDEKINVTVTGHGDNGMDVTVKYTTDSPNDLAFEELEGALRELQQQLTQVYNLTVYNEEYEDSIYDDVKESVLPLLSAVSQTIEGKFQWADEFYAAGTLAAGLDEIYASLEQDIQIPLTQALNVFNDGVKEIQNGQAYELFAQEFESLQQQWTMVYNVTVNNEEYSDSIYNDLKEQVTFILSGIGQNIDSKSAWADESDQAGTLAEDIDEILASFEDVQKQLTQALNVFNDGVKLIQNHGVSFDVEDGEEIDLEETKSIHVAVALPEGLEIDDDLFIEGVLVGKDGTNEPIFAYTDFEDGVDVAISRLTPGNAYTIFITKIAYGEVVDMDPETYMPIFENTLEDENGLATLNFSLAAATQPETTNIEVKYYNVSGGVLDIHFTEYDEVAPSWNVDILLNGNKINCEVGQDWNAIYGYPGELADGEYTLVFPAGSLMLDGNTNASEYSVTFVIENGVVSTGINAATVAKAANVKVIENGKLVIVKNGVKYNAAGQIVK